MIQLLILSLNHIQQLMPLTVDVDENTASVLSLGFILFTFWTMKTTECANIQHLFCINWCKSQHFIILLVVNVLLHLHLWNILLFGFCQVLNKEFITTTYVVLCCFHIIEYIILFIWLKLPLNVKLNEEN